jgi:predicted metal-dependent peptidase
MSQKLTKIEREKILNDYSHVTSRLTTKMIPIIKQTFEDIELIDLLMALPVKFDINEVDISKLSSKKDGDPVTAKDVALGGYILRDAENGNPDRLVVFLTFTKDIHQGWEEFFEMLLKDDSYASALAFIYLHEALHILMRHYDYYLNLSYLNIIDEFRSDLPEVSKNQILNHAFDYWINAYLIEHAYSGSAISRYQDTNSNFTGLYNPNLSPKVTTQQEIVQKLAEEAEIKDEAITDPSGNVIGTMTTVTIDGETSVFVDMNGGHDNIRQEPRESGAEQEIGEVLDSARNNLLEKTRGAESTGTLSKLGVDYSVPTDWFKALKSSLFTIVRHHTSQYDQTWGKIKNKFRHVAMMPGKVYYEKELAAIISIDQSGSMSDSDLEKINYVITELARKAKFVEILLHDTAVADQKRFIGSQFQSVREFVTNRVACGGTSHREVFQIVGKIKADNPKTKFIYLSFSDNYSDIEQVYSSTIFRGINAYWITTEERNTVNVPGMQISLEHGLLQE